MKEQWDLDEWEEEQAKLEDKRAEIEKVEAQKKAGRGRSKNKQNEALPINSVTNDPYLIYTGLGAFIRASIRIIQ